MFTQSLDDFFLSNSMCKSEVKHGLRDEEVNCKVANSSTNQRSRVGSKCACRLARTNKSLQRATYHGEVIWWRFIVKRLVKNLELLHLLGAKQHCPVARRWRHPTSACLRMSACAQLVLNKELCFIFMIKIRPPTAPTKCKKKNRINDCVKNRNIVFWYYRQSKKYGLKNIYSLYLHYTKTIK